MLHWNKREGSNRERVSKFGREHTGKDEITVNNGRKTCQKNYKNNKIKHIQLTLEKDD